MSIRISAILFFGFFLCVLPRQIFAQITTQFGGGASLPSGGWMMPSVSVIGTNVISGHVLGLAVTGVPSVSASWDHEGFVFSSVRYYATSDLRKNGLYAFGGAGCALRLRAGQLSSSPVGANFFGGVPDSYETTFGPCAEVGLGTSISLSSHSFISFIAWGNLNTMQPFAGLMILLGLAWK